VSVIPVLIWLRQEDGEFKTSLGYMVRLSKRKKKPKHINGQNEKAGL
jgi:hypothetical protein